MTEPAVGHALEILEFSVVDVYPSVGDYGGCVAMIVSYGAPTPTGYAVALPYGLETINAVIYEPGTTLVVTRPDQPANADGKSILAGALRLRDGRVFNGDESEDVKIDALKCRRH